MQVLHKLLFSYYPLYRLSRHSSSHRLKRPLYLTYEVALIIHLTSCTPPKPFQSNFCFTAHSQIPVIDCFNRRRVADFVSNEARGFFWYCVTKRACDGTSINQWKDPRGLFRPGVLMEFALSKLDW